jgi:hypothetical protein
MSSSQSQPCGAREPISRAAPEAEPAASQKWTQSQAIELCRLIEGICPKFGCHVALTGGCLYRDGERKDLDVLFYRIRQTPEIDHDGLFAALAEIGIEKTGGFGWCHKATFEGRKIDCFFPEEDGDYPTETPMPTDKLMDDERPF